jgi:nanoRNase/pAp phosphatase (c-di-AMP/oligoRNAs hydrolase)
MKDPHTALESLSEAFNRLYIWGLANGNRIRDEDLERFIKPTTLGIYAEEAQKMLDQQVREAMESAIWHSTKLCEIYAPLFADLVSHRIYEASGGVVLVRYQKLRENTNRISLRGSEDLPLDFNQILGRFGGGGHRYAAGLQAMKAKGVTIDDIVTSIKGLLSALPSNV